MASNSYPSKRAFDMRALWRLATWGASAVVALTVAVLAGHSETGSRRLAAAMSAGGNDAPAQKSSMPAQVARSTEAEAETRRLAERVRLLGSDRERLVARMAALERNLEDVTGSIKRQTPPIPSPVPPANTPDSPPAPTPSASAPAAPPPERLAILPERATRASAQEPTPLTQPQPPALAEPAPPAAATPDSPKPDIGIDIGGAVSFDGLRALWVSTKSHNAALFDGLHPLVGVRENNRTKAPELRLIVGPFENAEAASRLCAALSAARRYCQPVAFIGQRLAQADSVPMPERKPPPPKPAPQAPKSAWPFR